MTVKDILDFREKSYQEEVEMWRKLLSQEYPIGSVIEIDNQIMEVIDYGFQGGIATVEFEVAVPERRSKFYFDLPKFKKGGGR